MNNTPSSFKDPSGFIFKKNEKIYRHINRVYFDDYKLLTESGLYSELVNKKLLVPHKEISKELLEPLTIPVITYPYEWCFSQLKDAALLTLKIQKISMEHGMGLKDATSFNVQFYKGSPIFIDTLSFEKYKENQPWVAYRQFCEQFLCPLSLMSYTDTRLSELLIASVGSIPLDLTNKLLPISAKFNPSLLLHIFAQAASQKNLNNLRIKEKQKTVKMSLNALKELINNLESGVLSLKLKNEKTVWESYYFDNNNYSKVAFESKKSIVREYLTSIKPKTVWDIGANQGVFTKIAADLGASVLSLDNDHNAVEQNYLKVKENNETSILPLLIDITKPTPNLGWNLEERESIFDRSRPDTIMALALFHHLAIANNLPFNLIADFFAHHCQYLIIEFVPKTDSQVKLLLAAREDIFPSYDQKSFESEFSKYFSVLKTTKIKNSERVVYLMRSKV